MPRLLLVAPAVSFPFVVLVLHFLFCSYLLLGWVQPSLQSFLRSSDCWNLDRPKHLSCPWLLPFSLFSVQFSFLLLHFLFCCFQLGWVQPNLQRFLPAFGSGSKILALWRPLQAFWRPLNPQKLFELPRFWGGPFDAFGGSLTASAPPPLPLALSSPLHLAAGGGRRPWRPLEGFLEFLDGSSAGLWIGGSLNPSASLVLLLLPTPSRPMLPGKLLLTSAAPLPWVCEPRRAAIR